jgi:hypothetical protein
MNAAPLALNTRSRSRELACHFPRRIKRSPSSRPGDAQVQLDLVVKPSVYNAFTCESAHYAFASDFKITRAKSITLARAQRRSSHGGRTGSRFCPTKH